MHSRDPIVKFSLTILGEHRRHTHHDECVAGESVHRAEKTLNERW